MCSSDLYAGALPLWLSPVRAMVMPITDAQADYVNEVEQTLLNAGIRAEKDLRNEKISYKIREHTLQRVPFMLVAGDREKENHTVSVRLRAARSSSSPLMKMRSA